jgi:hypothetical protein
MKQPADVHNTTDSPVPRAFAYYRLIDGPQGQAMRRQFEQLAKSRLDLPEETIRQFGVAVNTGDRLGDTYIYAAFATRAGRSRARKDVEHALEKGIKSVSNPSPELLALFEQIDTDPDFVDLISVEHGADVL